MQECATYLENYVLPIYPEAAFYRGGMTPYMNNPVLRRHNMQTIINALKAANDAPVALPYDDAAPALASASRVTTLARPWQH
tara:strand:+ start:371 stop:616 length:246 start_codon:yes stop_codon:yes gene_type:complete